MMNLERHSLHRTAILIATSGIVLVGANFDGCQPEDVDPCSAPPVGWMPDNRMGGASCSYAGDCASNVCISDASGSYCAGTATDDCLQYGADFKSARVEPCGDGECGRELVNVCVRDDGRASCSPDCTLGDSCQSDEDCSSGGCWIESGASSGECVEACRDPASLTTNSPHLCPIDSTNASAGANTCVIDGDDAWCIPLVETQDVAAYGASCDEATPTDAGPAINLGLRSAHVDPANRDVCLRSCAYFVDETLQIGDTTTLRGQGADQTTIIRGNTQTLSSEHRWTDDASCVQPSNDQKNTKVVISNRGYNCGNRDITLRDFRIDGSQVSQTYSATNSLYPMVAIALSSVRDTIIEDLVLEDVAQDGIFIRNGGVDTVIRRNRILGFNRAWFNGAAINIEMQPGGDPVPFGSTLPDSDVANTAIVDNYVVARPNLRYCSGTFAHGCATDADCFGAATCTRAAAEVDLVNVNMTNAYLADLDTSDPNVDFSDKYFPNPTIERNVLLTASNGTNGVFCVGCEDAVVDHNCIAAFDAGNEAEAVARCEACVADPLGCVGPDPALVSFGGIVFPAMGGLTNQRLRYRTPSLGRHRISNNHIVGRGNSHAILAHTFNIGASDVLITGNHIEDFRAPALSFFQTSAIQTLFFDDVEVSDNVVDGLCGVGEECPATTGGAIHIWAPGNHTIGARVIGNTIRDQLIEIVNNARAGSIFVRHFNQPSLDNGAFVIADNTLSCIGGDAGFVLGRPGLPITANGRIHDNVADMGANDPSCHPSIANGPAQPAMYCINADNVLFSNNSFTGPASCNP